MTAVTYVIACVAGGMRERARPPYFSRAKAARKFRAVPRSQDLFPGFNSTLHQSSHGFATRVHGFATKTKALAQEIPSATQATYVTFLLTRQYTKNPELCNVLCGDEFGLELNWNGALNPVL